MTFTVASSPAWNPVSEASAIIRSKTAIIHLSLGSHVVYAVPVFPYSVDSQALAPLHESRGWRIIAYRSEGPGGSLELPVTIEAQGFDIETRSLEDVLGHLAIEAEQLEYAYRRLLADNTDGIELAERE